MNLSTSHKHSHVNAPAATVEERRKAAEWLKTLTDIPFVIGAEGGCPMYTGKLTVAQMDRLNYVSHVCGIDYRNTLPNDAATVDIHQLHVDCCTNMPMLERLAASEQSRRTSEAQAADLLSQATKHEWCWDGLCLSTMEPEKGSSLFHNLHGKINYFKRSGAFPGESSLAVFPSHDADGKKSHWISVHAVDLPKLKSLCQVENKTMNL